MADLISADEAWGAIRAKVNKRLEDIELTPELFGCKGDGITDDSAAFLVAISAASVLGRPLRADLRYRIKGLYVADQAVNLVGSGTLIHQRGQRIMMVDRPLGPARAVSSVAPLQIGASNVTTGMSLSVTRIAAADAQTFARDDVVMLSAADEYPWVGQYGTELGYPIHVYRQDLVKLMGVGLDYTGRANGGFIQGDVVTGAASGATAVVQAAGDNGQVTDVVIFRTVSGVFANGENLMVGGVVRGVASGAAYLLTSEILTYGYVTNVTVRKMSTAPFRIDGLTIEADGDVDQIVGAADRVQAFILKGLVDPAVTNVRIRSAWTRCWRFQSCWSPYVSGVRIDKLPNNAAAGEAGYGYAVEFCGATAYGLVQGLRGGNCRHAFTTNCDGIPDAALVAGTQSYATRERDFDGVPKYSLVRDCIIVNNRAEPFDTHVGDLFTVFENCHARWASGAALSITVAGGFKLRGFATRLRNCTTTGGVIGFNDYSGAYDAGFQYEQIYDGCDAGNYAWSGFRTTTRPVDQFQRRVIYNNCSIEGFVLDSSQPYYQLGWSAAFSGADITLNDCRASRFAGSPFSVAQDQRWTVRNIMVDMRQASASQASPPRVDGVPTRPLFVDGYLLVRHDTNPSLPQGFIRNGTASPIEVEMKNATVTNGDPNASAGAGVPDLPLIYNTGGNAAITGAVHFKENGKRVVLGTAAPTSGRWAVGDRVLNMTPVAGGFMGWVCVAAGTPGTWKGYGPIAA